MSTNLARLKKGTPPPADDAPDVIKADPRTEKGKERALQVHVPESVFDEFSQRAGQEFGFSKGAKKKLFLKMWEDYKVAQNM